MVSSYLEREMEMGGSSLFLLGSLMISPFPLA